MFFSQISRDGLYEEYFKKYLFLVIRILGEARAKTLIVEVAKYSQINLFDVASKNIYYLNYEKSSIEKIIPIIANAAEVDLLTLAYKNIGILKYENSTVSGEYFLISRVLKNNIDINNKPVIFDIGANVGEFSKMLRAEIPNAKIFAFEPNPNTFKKLINNIGEGVQCINVGMGAENKSATMFTYFDSVSSSHASIYSDVFHCYHKRDDLLEIDFQLMTLDLFCYQEKISIIDFLKIDTEGNELEVLKGAKQMLSEEKIKIIQFEFGECDVFSRVFLKDIYDILSNYNIYRLDSDRLIPCFEYSYVNEIFRFQNFVAVNKSFLLNEVNQKNFL